jgi:hypothetical protein
MESVKKLIASQKDKYDGLDYYLMHIEKASNNIKTHPDICIECCKSLIEGVSKTILKNLDNAYDSKVIDKLELSPLVRKTLEKMAEFEVEIEDDFIRRSVSLIHIMGEVRNKRGDISHGKHAPKEISSNADYSALVFHVSEGIVYYILKNFVSIDISYKQSLIYEDHEDFNAMLDEASPLEGKVLYSRAVFDQFPIDYEIQLEEYYEQQQELKDWEDIDH